jgi:pimeloyl-ACP methyl ester carboxylesterase
VRRPLITPYRPPGSMRFARALPLIPFALLFAPVLCAGELNGGEREPRRPRIARLLEAGRTAVNERYVWSDELVFHDWRIRKNWLTDEHWVINPDGERVASGTYQQCQASLEIIKKKESLPEMSGKMVLLLHGLGESRKSLKSMSDFLENSGGYEVASVIYPGMYGEIGKYAESLDRILQHLDGVEEVYLVSHSLGSLVVRHYWQDQTDSTVGLAPDPRIKRIVMISPINNGSGFGRILNNPQLLESFLGEAGRELGKTWQDFSRKLATPSCEFGVIASSKDDVAGKPEGTVSKTDRLNVEMAKLPGASDFIVTNGGHFSQPASKTVQAYTINFLRHGYFVSADQRQPLPALDKQAASATADAPAPKLLDVPRLAP